MSTIRSGFRVVGDSVYGELHCWYFDTLETANAFAQHLCSETGKEVDVHKYLGSWKRRDPPAEWISSTDAAEGGIKEGK